MNHWGGFVVKKPNGKNTYLDENLKEITKEYDIMDPCRIENGILIVANIPDGLGNNVGEFLKNGLKFKLINIQTGKIIGEDYEYIYGMNEDKYNTYSNNKYENESIIKNLKAITNGDYINTKLYNDHYDK